MADLRELRDLIIRASTGPQPGGLIAVAADQVAEPIGSVLEPCFAFTAQGGKRLFLGDRVIDYNAGQYIVVTVDLPVSGQVTQASPDEPFVGFGLPLRPALIAELLLEAGPVLGKSDTPSGIVMSDVDDGLLDAVVRLLRLYGDPLDYKILGPAAEREVHWRLLTGPQGDTIRQIGLADSRLSLVGRAIGWIRGHYDQVIRIEDLAAEVGMSVSSLNRHFRAVTEMSPVQYQKRIRLQEARLQLMASPNDVQAVGYAVGYDSPSQFSREYRRMFGSPPGQDVARLLAATD